MFLSIYKSDQCWICGSMENPTREHKFKSSALKETSAGQFPLYITEDIAGSKFRTAQGPKSDSLKFKATICERCNSNTTQESDLAFEELRTKLFQLSRNNIDVQKIWEDPAFQPGGKNYNPMFRYFAKLLGCHLAEICAPIPRHLSRFVRKLSERNCIWLEISSETDADGVSAHGGLVIITRRPNFGPVRIHSSLTFGDIKFCFFYNWTWPERMEMSLCNRDFVRDCVQNSIAALSDPMTARALRSVGLEKALIQLR
jgi:hypothetical protein